MLKRLFWFLFGMMVTSGILGVFLGAYLLYFYSHDLPAYDQLKDYEPPVLTRFYSKDGLLLEEYAKERRIYVPIEAMPKTLIQAFLATEDQNFYHHPGVDIISVFRAIVQNIMHWGQGKPLIGGSTITQQVVKNFLLTNERSLSRKIKEAILAFRITQVFSKDRILELYLNEIYLGAGAYGVASAALTYFDKSLEELTVEECALLAALPKAPSDYEPRRHPKRALERRNWVIERMRTEDFIDDAQKNRALQSPIALKQGKAAATVKADFFAEAVRQEIDQTLGNRALYEGGLTVRTTLDPALQKLAEVALREGLVRFDRRKGYRPPSVSLASAPSEQWAEELGKMESPSNGEDGAFWAAVQSVAETHLRLLTASGTVITLEKAGFQWALRPAQKATDIFKSGQVIVVRPRIKEAKKTWELHQIPEINGGMVIMDVASGKVKAMVGGYSFHRNQYNRVTQAKRQTGSVFKPFVYLAALEQGFSPNDMIDDGPLAIDQGPGLPAWTPKNFNNDYLGMMTLRAGLEKSRNLVTIRLSQEVGMGKIVDVTKRLAIHPSPPRNPAMVLGTTEATLLTMTHAYSMIANGGYRTEISLVDYVQDRYGRTVWRAKDLVCQGCDQALPLQPPSLLVTDRHVIDPRTSYQMISLLEGVIQRGTGQRARGLRRYFAGKTGTTNGPNRSTLDSWFIGFTAHTAIGVYVGYDQPRNLGIKESGATVALPIVTDFLLAADSLLPDVPFPVPDGIVFRSVDPSTGSILSAETKLPHTAIREAFKAEFLATETTEPSSDEAYKKASENPEITPLEAQQLDQAAQNEILAPSSPITAPTASSPATDSTDTKDTSDRSESADGPSGFY